MQSGRWATPSASGMPARTRLAAGRRASRGQMRLAGTTRCTWQQSTATTSPGSTSRPSHRTRSCFLAGALRDGRTPPSRPPSPGDGRTSSPGRGKLRCFSATSGASGTAASLRHPAWSAWSGWRTRCAAGSGPPCLWASGIGWRSSGGPGQHGQKASSRHPTGWTGWTCPTSSRWSRGCSATPRTCGTCALQLNACRVSSTSSGASTESGTI
mmetsp:Transcript_61551/g.179899  ORF Transcript_61551/g.179899 Transcript_61551/m.179899 type:complete len:212 (-) Transcript_61551:982-1617(-)